MSAGDNAAVLIEEESVLLLHTEQELIAEAPFHQRPAGGKAAVAAESGSSTITIQPYTDDPDRAQAPLVDTASKSVRNTPTIYHLLVPFTLFTLAFGGNLAPKINIILSLVCREYYAKQQGMLEPSVALWANLAGSDVVRALEGDVDEICQVAEVHATASTVTMWVGLLTGLLGTFTSAWLGALSDRIGRRPVLMIGVLGPFLADLTIIIAARWSNLKSYNLYYLAAFFDGGTGSYILVVAMCHSYATDCTPPGNKRAAAFGLFHGVLFGGMAVGPTIASFMVSRTGNALTFFYVGLFLQIVFFFLVVFVIPESLSQARMLQAQSAYRQQRRLAQHIAVRPLTLRTFVRRINFLEPLSAFWPSDGTKLVIKRNMVILAIMDALCVGNTMGEIMAGLMYAEFMFHWTSVETGYYVTTVGFTRIVLLFVLLPNILRVLKAHVDRYRRRSGTYLPENKIFGATDTDILLIRGSAGIALLAYAGFMLTTTPALYLVCGATGALSGALAPTMEAAISKHVPRQNTGMILGAVALMHSIARVVAPTIYLSVYSATVGWFPKAIFVVFLSSFGTIFVATFFIRRNITGGLMEDDGEDGEDDDHDHDYDHDHNGESGSE
ncbi:major facilitator superfamily domain-containing protein [Lipomyces orientalis]|uniref:Major facilitator superfamily domain-containing protein n=1 Tax=Lipomyces orientalis TaxID=1233043 RepID=A0ACC3TL66_9ASCO